MVERAEFNIGNEGAPSPAGYSGGAIAAVSVARAAIARMTAAEASRRSLWAPVFLGAGAAVYFTLKAEPSFPLAAGLFLAAAAMMRLVFVRSFAIALAFFMGGFLLADLRTARVEAPALTRDLGFVAIEGRIVAIDEAPKLRRLIIAPNRIEKIDPEAIPALIRLSWRGKEFAAAPGDRITARARLSPPPPPVAPMSYDFARHLFFQRIGAVGFLVTPPTPIAETAPPVAAQFAAAIERARVNLSRRIIRAAPGDAGAIVSAVVTGKREAISEEADAAFRDSGLAHLLSISGLHMSIATGLIFFGARALLALFEPIALRFPIKKWAAAAALLSGGIYLLLSGNAWPAQRAYVMTSIFFIAILFDRRALSLRNVAIAAFIIIALAPEAVLHPGFQMSFAAVTALIAAYEWHSAREDTMRSFSPLARLRRYLAGIVATDVISASATAPYSLFHFSRTANFGLVANMISIPLMGFWVMPAAIVALLLAPLDLDAPAWRAAAAGVEIMLGLAAWTSALPGAVTVFPHWPASALVVLTLGGLWMCLMSQAWRLAGLVAVPIAAALIAAAPHPALFVSAKGENAGVIIRGADGARMLALFDRRKDSFAAKVWMEFSGLDIVKKSPVKLADHARCDAAGCVVSIEGKKIALSSFVGELGADCARADLVIATYFVPPDMQKSCAVRLIDRREAYRNGAHAIYVGADGEIRIASVAAHRGARPWTGAKD